MKSIKAKGENVNNFPFDMLETYMKRVSVKIKNKFKLFKFICKSIIYF